MQPSIVEKLTVKMDMNLHQKTPISEKINRENVVSAKYFLGVKQRVIIGIAICLLLPNLSCCQAPLDPVDVDDQAIFIIKGKPLDELTFPTYAVEMHFLTSGMTDMDKSHYDSLFTGPSDGPRVGMSLAAWAQFNKTIGELCTEVICKYQVQLFINGINAKIEEAKAR